MYAFSKEILASDILNRNDLSEFLKASKTLGQSEYETQLISLQTNDNFKNLSEEEKKTLDNELKEYMFAKADLEIVLRHFQEYLNENRGNFGDDNDFDESTDEAKALFELNKQMNLAKNLESEYNEIQAEIEQLKKDNGSTKEMAPTINPTLSFPVNTNVLNQPITNAFAVLLASVTKNAAQYEKPKPVEKENQMNANSENIMKHPQVLGTLNGNSLVNSRSTNINSINNEPKKDLSISNETVKHLISFLEIHSIKTIDFAHYISKKHLLKSNSVYKHILFPNGSKTSLEMNQKIDAIISNFLNSHEDKLECLRVLKGALSSISSSKFGDENVCHNMGNTAKKIRVDTE